MVRWLRMAMVALGLGVAGLGGPPAARADDGPSLLGKAGDFTLAPPEVSEDAPGNWYLRADAGYVDPIGGALYAGPVPVSAAPGAGWSAGAGVGYRVLPVLRAELGIEYLSLGSAPSPFGDRRGAATVGLAGLSWDVITIAGFTPYLSAGAGLAHTGRDAPVLGGGDRWGFAWSVGGGVSYALSEALSIDLGYRYLDLGGRTASSFAPFEARELAAHQIRLGVRYALK